MSTIIATKAKDKSAIVIGCDLQETSGDRRLESAPMSKWIEYGDIAFGMAGWKRFLNLSQYHQEALFDGSPNPCELSLRLRKLLMDDGWMPATKDRYQPEYGVEALYVRHGEVWKFNGTLEYGPMGDFTAIGSGSHFALGAMSALSELWQGSGKDAFNTAKDLVSMGLMAAGKFDIYTSGQWVKVIE